MAHKTKITAEDGKQDLVITREFDLPLELLFLAHTDPEIVEQWMSHEYTTTKVLKLENKKHGSWQYESTDKQGNVVFRSNGVIHDIVPNQKIIRTFDMENPQFPVQLEFMDFEPITENSSKLTIHIVYKSIEARDQMLKLPFSQGMNMAHDRLQEIVNNLKLTHNVKEK